MKQRQVIHTGFLRDKPGLGRTALGGFQSGLDIFGSVSGENMQHSIICYAKSFSGAYFANVRRCLGFRA
jgi:hypothetical protein